MYSNKSASASARVSCEPCPRARGRSHTRRRGRDRSPLARRPTCSPSWSCPRRDPCTSNGGFSRWLATVARTEVLVLDCADAVLAHGLILSRAHSARSRDSSICSGVIGLAPAALSLPVAAALTQLLRVCSTRPSSRAAGPAPTSSALFTACSLNSAVYSCFGISFPSRPSSVDANHRPLEDEIREAAHLADQVFMSRRFLSSVAQGIYNNHLRGPIGRPPRGQRGDDDEAECCAKDQPIFTPYPQGEWQILRAPGG